MVLSLHNLPWIGVEDQSHVDDESNVFTLFEYFYNNNRFNCWGHRELGPLRLLLNRRMIRVIVASRWYCHPNHRKPLEQSTTEN